MILRLPLHWLQVVMSIANTRFKRRAQVIADRPSPSLPVSPIDESEFFWRDFLSLLVINERSLLFGANTP